MSFSKKSLYSLSCGLLSLYWLPIKNIDGFTVPIISSQLYASESGGYPSDGTPMIGANIAPEIATYNHGNVPVQVSGNKVTHVYKNSSGQRMGLQPGDVIIGVDGFETPDYSRLIEVVQGSNPEAPFTLQIVRDGNAIELSGNYGSWETYYKTRREKREAKRAKRKQAQLRKEMREDPEVLAENILDSNKTLTAEYSQLATLLEDKLGQQTAQQLGLMLQLIGATHLQVDAHSQIDLKTLITTTPKPAKLQYTFSFYYGNDAF